MYTGVQLWHFFFLIWFWISILWIHSFFWICICNLHSEIIAFNMMFIILIWSHLINNLTERPLNCVRHERVKRENTGQRKPIFWQIVRSEFSWMTFSSTESVLLSIFDTLILFFADFKTKNYLDKFINIKTTIFLLQRQRH